MNTNEARFLMRARPLTAVMVVIGLVIYGGCSTALLLKHGLPTRSLEWAVIGWGYLMALVSLWGPWITWRARRQYPHIKTGYE